MTEALYKQQLLNNLYNKWTLKQIPLESAATQIVFGHGNAASPLMIIGEAPGQQEDAQGKPFVGRSGQLLSKALTQAGIARDQVFITNTVKCRPPGNRTPTPQEISFFKATFLDPEIKIIQPKIILTLGAVALNALVENAPAISKARGIAIKTASGLIIPTYHPAYILRNPPAYELFLEDIKAAAAHLT